MPIEVTYHAHQNIELGGGSQREQRWVSGSNCHWVEALDLGVESLCCVDGTYSIDTSGKCMKISTLPSKPNSKTRVDPILAKQAKLAQQNTDTRRPHVSTSQVSQ